jgi:hypothetical protein
MTGGRAKCERGTQSRNCGQAVQSAHQSAHFMTGGRAKSERGNHKTGPVQRCCGECCYVTACFPCYNTLYDYIDQRVQYLAVMAGRAWCVPHAISLSSVEDWFRWRMCSVGER